MFDLGLLTLPFIAALGVFGLALFTGETLVVSSIDVPDYFNSSYFESIGLTEASVTHILTDKIREIDRVAGSELEGFDLDSTLDRSIGAFENYFGLDQLLTGTRDLFGLVPYYVSGELTGHPDDITLTLRVFYGEEERRTDVVEATGTIEGLDEIMREGALEVVELINPYIVALYWRRIEADDGNYAFPRTHEVLDRYLASQPVEAHFLAYGLLGRTLMVKAERQAGLTPEEQQAAYAEAARYFEAALMQQPDFHFASVNLASLHLAQGDFERADAYFARAVESDPNGLEARVRWADALERQGRIRDAAFQWVAAVEIDRDDPKLRQELAEAYLALGMTEEAQAQIDRAIALDPMQAALYRNRLGEGATMGN
jgi:tetratricopeptide (TPR) repeat protein